MSWFYETETVALGWLANAYDSQWALYCSSFMSFSTWGLGNVNVKEGRAGKRNAETYLSRLGQLDFAEPAVGFRSLVEQVGLVREALVDFLNGSRDGSILQK